MRQLKPDFFQNNARKDASLVFALMANGLLAGAFFYAKFNVLTTFREVPVDVHLSFRVALMKHNSLTMQLLMASAIISGFLLSWTNWQKRSRRNLALLALILSLATFGITRFGNVPINQEIRSWQANGLSSDWMTRLQVWDNYHTLRTITAISSFLLVVILVPKRLPGTTD
ncbi:MAG TPA: DUF1772 domain-containing protein [Flavitalea sp.]|nr:DUF1772 domain-containing protein [Flavitalea sp.]